MAVSTKSKVIVRSFDRENDENEAFVSVNGDACQIKLGEEVGIGPEVIEALKNASMTIYINEFDDRGMPTKGTKEKVIPRYLVEKI